MIEFLNSPGVWPFTLALALVLGLLLLELFMLLIGSSLLAADVDGADIDLDSVDIGADDFDVEIDTDQGSVSGASPALSSWFGLGRVPLAIWIASALTGFGLSGFILQQVLSGITGFVLPAMLAIPAAIPPAILFARIVSGWLGRLIPKTETSAITQRGFSGLSGVITQGTARRGEPAEARVRDRHGNLHYVRLEPYEDGAILPEGTEVTVIRRRDGTLRAMEVTPA